MEFQFKRTRIDKLSRETMIDELEKAAQRFDYIEFGWRDFAEVANISASPVKKEFGSWKKALSALKAHLNRKGLDLSPRKIPPNRIHSDKEMFDELERIWRNLGHRPSRTEWELSKSKIHYNTYKQRFGGWKDACLKFIEYKMGERILSDDEASHSKEILNNAKTQEEMKIEKENSRSITVSLRLKILARDNFRCVFCGRSPATELGVKLHIDHKIPFSRGGASTIDNLQTLCQYCNLGKGDTILDNR